MFIRISLSSICQKNNLEIIIYKFPFFLFPTLSYASNAPRPSLSLVVLTLEIILRDFAYVNLASAGIKVK